jgi:tetratricopeptide (TPR) repeat protein
MKQITYFYKGLISVLNKHLTVQQIHEYLLTYVSLDSQLVPDGVESEILLEIVFSQKPVDKEKKLITDTLVNYTNRILAKEKNSKLLLELGEFMLTQGELKIVFDLATFVQNSAGEEMVHEELKASSFILLAEHYIKQSMWDKALECIDKAKTIFKNDKIGIAKCEYLLGLIKLEKGDIESSKSIFQNLIEDADIQNESVLPAMIYMKLGIISCFQDENETALCLYNKALKIFNQINDMNGRAEVMLYKGLIYKKLKDDQSAISQFDNCIDLAKKYDLVYIINLGYLYKAEIFLREKDADLASVFLNRSMQLSYQLNHRSSIAKAYKVRGQIAKLKTNYLVAENYFSTSIRLNNELGLELESAKVLFELGLLYKETKESKKALVHLENCLSIVKKQNIKKFSEEIESHIHKI